MTQGKAKTSTDSSIEEAVGAVPRKQRSTSEASRSRFARRAKPCAKEPTNDCNDRY